MHTIPRLIRWIFSVALFLFVLMFIMRLAAYWYFKPPDLSFNGALKSFILGFRFDAREVGIVCLLLLLIGSVPALHPFKTRAGRQTTLSLLFIALLAIIIFYVFDFLHFRYLLQRLNASALSFLEDAKISGSMVWQTYPVTNVLKLQLIKEAKQKGLYLALQYF